MKYDTKLFINKSILIHGDKYDYSLVEYKNLKSKIDIICKTHGVFKQTPSKHLIGRGCQICGGTKLLSTDEFITKSNNKHNFKYDYSLTDYIDSHTSVKIICKEHGVFEQLPYVHMNGCGCSICGIKKNNFLDKAKKKYGNKYDYLTEYKNNYTKIKFKCCKHGEIEQFPQLHLKSGCVLCNRQNVFISKSNVIHNNKYNYSLVNYVNKTSKIKIICPLHGEFEQEPMYHIRGNGCKKCADDTKRLSTDIFIKKAKMIHNDKYDYSNVNYIDTFTKVKVICEKHGVFNIKPNEHVSGSKRGCPYCSESIGEKNIHQFLKDKNINFRRQEKFDNCKNILKLSFDFYLPDYNICIEYDGIQHFESIKYFGGIKKLICTKINDDIKNDFCEKSKIKLIRIKYNEDIFEKLKIELQNI